MKWSIELKPLCSIHIAAIISAILSIFIGLLIYKKFKGKDSDSVYGFVGILLIVLEAIKVIYSFKVYGEYHLDRIPFQICTLELFFLWAVPYVKNTTIKDMMMSYSLIALYGACFYFVNPSTIFNNEYVVFGVQAIIWHDLIIIIGIFTLFEYKVYNFKALHFLIRGWLLWILASLIAAILDNLFVQAGINFFYLSPAQMHIPYIGLNWIFNKPEPYILFFIAYLIYFSLGLIIVYGFIMLIGEYNKKYINS